MRVSDLRKGDIVEANVRGYRFRARVVDPDDRTVPGKHILVEPLHPTINMCYLTARQVSCRLERAETSRRRAA